VKIIHTTVFLCVTGRPILVNFRSLFRGHKFSKVDISDNFCRRVMKFGKVRVLADQHLFPEFCLSLI